MYSIQHINKLKFDNDNDKNNGKKWNKDIKNIIY